AFAVFLTRQTFVSGPDALVALARAREIADRAVEVAPHRGEPWVARAHARFNADDPAGAARALRHALRASPSLAGAPDLGGRILLEVGLLTEGVAHSERAYWLDPSMPNTFNDLTRGLELLGERRRVDELLAAVEARSPTPLQRLQRLRITMWRDERLDGRWT